MFVDIFFPFRLILKGILFLDLQKQLVRRRQGWGVSDSRVFSSVGTVKYGISQEMTLFFVRCVGAWSLTWFCNFTFLRPLLPPFILSSSLQETSPPCPRHGTFLTQPPSISFRLPLDDPVGSAVRHWCEASASPSLVLGALCSCPVYCHS